VFKNVFEKLAMFNGYTGAGVNVNFLVLKDPRVAKGTPAN